MVPEVVAAEAQGLEGVPGPEDALNHRSPVPLGPRRKEFNQGGIISLSGPLPAVPPRSPSRVSQTVLR